MYNHRFTLFLTLLVFIPLSQAAPLNGSLVSSVAKDERSNSQYLLTPASIQKLLTATAAIKLLGADYRFNTHLSVYSSPQGDTNLHIELSGDPSLSSEDLSLLLNAATKYGRSFDNISIDDSRFSGHVRSRGQVWNDMGMCFAAPVSASNIDGNCINGNIKPGSEGQVAKLHLSDARLLKIDNQVKTVSPHKATFCELDLLVSDKNHYRLQGCLASNAKMIPLRFSIMDNQAYFAQKLKYQLNSNGIKAGEVHFSSQAPANETQRFTHQSKPLIDLLGLMLAKSNNLYADSIFKAIAFESNGVGSFTSASELVQQLFLDLALPAENLQIVDGSGLSRENLLNADFVYALLKLWLADPDLSPLVNQLAIAGEKGTLKYRPSLRNVPLKGHVYAKSGYLKGVMNLAGFVQTADGFIPFVYFNTGVSLEKDKAKAVKEKRIKHPAFLAEQHWLEQLFSD